MPLIRFQVRNEFGLGDPDLYRAANKDDPNAILDGIAVAGLVGILRQLGDLAEFAAEVFHDLHEQVTATASRGRKMTIRIQHIESALRPLEKAVLAQTSHIHFAYTAGSDWHPEIQTEQNHLGRSDLPQFIMESYEECRDPPHLFLLDKFDAAGAGACLKRYTDPSFFKMAWASSELTKEEIVQREPKAKKIKKKRSRQRNGEVSHAASISRPHSSKQQFAFPDTDAQSFARETISTSDPRSRSELASRSTSFDLGTRSGYIECVFDVNSSFGPEEVEHNEFSTPNLKMLYSVARGSGLLDEQNGEGVDDNTPDGSLQGLSAPRSSPVTWDEKTEIVKPTSQLCDGTLEDCGQTSESLPLNFNPSNLEQEAPILGNVDQEDILFDVENIPESFSGVNQFDEVTSETDNYMDALNTMESETETDSECQTKREVELRSNFKHQDVESATSAIHEIAAHNSDSSIVEPPIASYSLLKTEITPNLSNSVFSESLADAQPPRVIPMDYKANGSVNTGLCESHNPLDMSRMTGSESVGVDPLSDSSVLNSNGNKIKINSCKSQESPEIVDVPSIRFWTNGTLLGLEPSKPPDFSVSNIVSQNPTPATITNNCDLSSNTVNAKLHHDGSVGNSGALARPVEDGEHNSSPVEDRNGSPVANSSDLSQVPPDQSIGRTGNLVQPIDHNIDVQSSEPGRNNIESPLSISDLGHRFLGNGLRRKAAHVHSNTSEPSSIESTDSMKLQEWPHRAELKGKIGEGFQTSREPTPNEQLGLGPPKNFLSSRAYYTGHSSPPLQHMKISFHPIDGFETSLLKLQFPDRHHFHESIQDVIFPSFQLLPEPAIPVQDIGSESDDDTFCKSSPYMSEDPLSPHSESNSEQWESSETTGSKDQEIYDALRRVSSSASISSPLELEGISHLNIHPACELGSSNAENGIKSFDIVPSLDLPSLDAMNSTVNRQEAKGNPKAKDLLDPALQCSHELALPPPLPPLQWRIMKGPFATEEDKQYTLSESSNQSNKFQVLESTTPQQPKPATPKQPNFTETIAHSKEITKLNGRRDLDQPANGKELDEREDFLHQIRTKSFSLKRTVTARPGLMPGPTTTNIKVAAILEKANAIRQAFVGSDEEGDDENWSDG
ncbi:SCAR-like protein 2 [Tasmannia lanceolata]|uniref:SCAR-like protein 2 n=1 Tax=Tasmannia lanceolata TaxID=3420 RepID=UPI004063F8CB